VPRDVAAPLIRQVIYEGGTLKDTPIQALLAVELVVEKTGFASFLVFVDNCAVTARKSIMAGFKFFRHRILGAKRKFVKKANSNDVEATREIFTDLGGGKILKRTEEEIISYEDMPDCVRREMLRQQTNEAELNEKELTLAKAHDAAQKSQDEELKELMTMAA
jgi:hypothetical protein